MRNILLGLIILVMGGCMPTLSELHAENPEQTATVHAEYKWLAACAKEQAQLQDWWFEDFTTGKLPVYIIDSTARPLVRLYMNAPRNTAFELTFQPAGEGLTRVEYRGLFQQQKTKEEAWPIIERCASQLSAASAHAGPER